MTALVDQPTTGPASDLETLESTLVGDFAPMLVDYAACRGSYLRDELTGNDVLDMGMFFSSSPLGHNPDCLTTDTARLRLAEAARIKPSNPDFASRTLADFVAVFRRIMMPVDMPHLFLIDGGALAVENALKVAFDWKAQKLGVAGADPDPQLTVLHLERAFHGRSGYTMSLTNTDPTKISLFPKFDWPRVFAPALGEEGGKVGDETNGELSAAENEALARIEAVLVEQAERIACFVYEPIQGEGGDRHLGAAFLRRVEELCREHDVLTVADEVQMGGGLTGVRWTHETMGLTPDLICFGKKTQVCGVIGGRRVDEVPENAFVASGRISSTWGGSLVDMVRFGLLYEEIERNDLMARAADMDSVLRAGLERVVASSNGLYSAPRSRGLVGAISCVDGDLRDAVLRSALADEHCLLLPCGTRSIRWRPSLTVTEEELHRSFEVVEACLARSGR